MIRFIENIGDYYSQHFFTDDFHKKVFDKAGYVTQKKDSDGNKTANHLTEINARITPLREKYFRFKNDLLSIQREKDKVKRTSEFHREVLDALGYINGTPEYNHPVFINDTEVIPVRYNYTKGGKPYLFIMEMKAIVHEGDKEPLGIYEQTWDIGEWEKVFPSAWGHIILKPDVVKEALSELFLLPEDERPTYVIMLAGAKIFLIHYEKWKYDSFLLFDLEQLFAEVVINRDYFALFYALLAKTNFLGNTDSLLQSLDEDAHKAAYGVTQNLKKGVIYAVESLANEAIWYKKTSAKTHDEKQAIEKLMAEDKFAKELKDECLSLVYRLLFLFYAEAREDLEILPVKDSVYQKGYSLEMLRDMEMVPLTTDSSRNGYFISKSLWKLFDHLHTGVKTKHGFEMKPLDSPLFDNAELNHLSRVQFRNVVLQQIIKQLSLSDSSGKKRRGRISYANLGINQLGSVYESLLAFSGFFAADTLIEVKAADDPNDTEDTFLVPLVRRDDFKEAEIVKEKDEYGNLIHDRQIPKGQFVYRLNGRDRKKSASYYTPEVLTQTTVKYTLKGIIDRLKERIEKNDKEDDNVADELLALKILEPAMGAAAFHNEVINQLADAYLELKETEEVRKGHTRIVPGSYNDELQKVKAFIAANNVYGVDLNPTAVELGKLSLWLNCMHRNMETPFFAHRLGTGNAVVGCWLKVYDEQDVIIEYPKEGTTKQRSTPVPRAWWAKAPKRVRWATKGYTRKPGQYYHFILPDDNMLASVGIPLIKEEIGDSQRKNINAKKKEFLQPLTRQECARLEKICTVIDALLEEHYRQIKGIIKDTTSAYAVYGQPAPQMAMKGYDDKERLAESRNARSAPFYKLRMIMDYWCSLWFWDARQAADFPTRSQWYSEVENILGVDLAALGDTTDPTAILEHIKKYGADTWSLHGSDNRLNIVTQLREQHRFFHHELEFVEVFKERGGFDVIVGNPPWVSIEMDEAGILSDKNPEIAIRNLSAPEVRIRAKDILGEDSEIKNKYLSEELWAVGTKSFLGANQNFWLLEGQRNNLYKCILVNSVALISKAGFCGLLHPDGIYDDPNGGKLRKHIYKRLKYHFQFRNELILFSDVDHDIPFSINVYEGLGDSINFVTISNLFHPLTINGSFQHNGVGECGGYKYLNNDGVWVWNTVPHRNRVLNITERELRILNKTFENNNDFESTKLVSMHSIEIITLLEKLGVFNNKFSQTKSFITDCWNETTAVKSGIVEKRTDYASEEYDHIISGPHFFVSNPFYKSPRAVCKVNSDYDVIFNHTEIDQYTTRYNFFPKNISKVKTTFAGVKGDLPWIRSYRICFSKMLSSKGERTLQPAIIPPTYSHMNSVISVQFQNDIDLLEFAGLCSSTVLDFYIKVLGRDNLYGDSISSMFLGIQEQLRQQIIARVLVLNCISDKYSHLWNQFWENKYSKFKWSRADFRLKPFASFDLKLDKDKILNNLFERRLALVEIDVLSAMAFNLTLDELVTLYTTQFQIMQEYELGTYYDQRGNIIYTNSKGLLGVGIDRKDWENLTIETSPMQRTLKEGTTYTHTIMKSELYRGQQVTYYPPFDKCDRVEDYKVAWAHFEKILNEGKQKNMQVESDSSILTKSTPM